MNKADIAPAQRGDDNEREYDGAFLRMKRASPPYRLLRALITLEDVERSYWNMDLYLDEIVPGCCMRRFHLACIAKYLERETCTVLDAAMHGVGR